VGRAAPARHRRFHRAADHPVPGGGDALANEISVIDHGKVIAHDTPDGLKRKIGGQCIRVRPTDRARMDDVHRILAEIGRNEPQASGRDELTVAVNGEDALAATVSRLAADGIAVTELSLHLPSLDEVFMTLTGERVGSDGAAHTQKEEAA
jgi:oleandomycin transport system ATP-binding protein